MSGGGRAGGNPPFPARITPAWPGAAMGPTLSLAQQPTAPLSPDKGPRLTPLHVTLVLATLLCALVVGFLFAFAVVVMPGIGRLRDREHIRAFQVMDRVIQDNDPLFMAVRVGSVLALLAATVLAFAPPPTPDPPTPPCTPHPPWPRTR